MNPEALQKLKQKLTAIDEAVTISGATLARAAINATIPAIASSVANRQIQSQQQLPISSPNPTTLSPQVQRLLNMRQ